MAFVFGNKIAISLLLFVIFGAGLATAGYKFGRGKVYKYYTKPNWNLEQVHPNWWKRAGVGGVPVADYAEEGQFAEDPRAMMDSFGCDPEATFDIDGRSCVPLMCRKVVQVKKGDCICILPGFGCMIYE